MNSAFEPDLLAHVDEHSRFGFGGNEHKMNIDILGQEVRIESRVMICDSAYNSGLSYEAAIEYLLGVNHCVSMFMVLATEPMFFHSMARYKRLRYTLLLAASSTPFTIANSLTLNGSEIRTMKDVNTVLENIVFQSDDSEAKVTLLEIKRAEGRIRNDEEGLIL